VILVGFNAKHFLPKCLRSLQKGTYKNFEILYVDNGSKDGTATYIKKNHPYVRLFEKSRNLGFSPAHEGMIEKAKGDAILILNTDTVLAKNLLEELVKALYKEKSIGAVQPKILMFPSTDKIDSIGSFFLPSGFLYHVGYEKDANLPQYNKPMEIFSTKGAVMLIKKAVLEKVSFPASKDHKASIFDLDYFTLFEDTDLSHRIWLSGYRILYVPSTYAYHVGGGTVKKMVHSFVIFHGEKNRLATYIKNLSLSNLLRALPQMILMSQIEAFAYLLIKGRIDIFFAVYRALLWNIAHIGITLQKRKFIQNVMRSVPDDDFLPKLTKHIRPSYYFYLLFSLKYYKD